MPDRNIPLSGFMDAASQWELVKFAGRTDADIFKQKTNGLDVRFYTGVTDISELPSADKL